MGGAASALSQQLLERRLTKEEVPAEVLSVLSFDKLCRRSDQTLSLAELASLFNKHTDVFLSHEWGDAERDYHGLVKRINAALRQRGLCTWFDEELLKMSNTANNANNNANASFLGRAEDRRQLIAKGVDRSRLVLCFVTRRYMERVGGSDETDCNKIEFKHATAATTMSKRREKDKERRVLAVVLEEEMLDAAQWTGALQTALGNTLHLDLSRIARFAQSSSDSSGNDLDNKNSEEDEREFNECVEELYGSIVTRIGRSLAEIARDIDWQRLVASASSAPAQNNENNSNTHSNNNKNNNNSNNDNKSVPVQTRSNPQEQSSNAKKTLSQKKERDRFEETVLWFVDHVQIPYTVATLYASTLREEQGVQDIPQLIKKLIMQPSFLREMDIFDAEDAREIRVQLQLSDHNERTPNSPGSEGVPTALPVSIESAQDVVQFFSAAKYCSAEENARYLARTVALIDKNRTLCEAIGEREGCKLIARFFAHYLRSSSDNDNTKNETHLAICETCLHIICTLARCDMNDRTSVIAHNVDLLGWFGACESVHRVMSELGKDPRIALWTCIVVRHLSTTNNNNRINFGFNGTCEEMMRLMNVHAKSVEIMQQALGAIWNLCANNHVENQTKLGSYGVCDVIKKVLRQHMNRENIVEVAFGCVRSLVANHNDNKTRFGATGMCEVLCIALSTHIQHTNIALQGCSAIWGLASIRMNKQKLFDVDVCEVMCVALKNHASNALIAEQACGAVWSLATNSDAFREGFHAAGVPPLVLQALRAHAENAAVAETASGALMVLCANRDDVKKELRALGAEEVLDRVAHLHFNFEAVAKNARTATKNLNSKTLRHVASTFHL